LNGAQATRDSVAVQAAEAQDTETAVEAAADTRAELSLSAAGAACLDQIARKRRPLSNAQLENWVGELDFRVERLERIVTDVLAAQSEVVRHVRAERRGESLARTRLDAMQEVVDFLALEIGRLRRERSAA
jgi:hypothetical protein